LTLRAVAFSGVDLQRYADVAMEAKNSVGRWITPEARDRNAALLEDRSQAVLSQALDISVERYAGGAARNVGR